MARELICIGCPLGCLLTVDSENKKIIVNGHQCNIGAKYAKEEITNPTRNITTSVRVNAGEMPMLSVKTKQPIPKNKIMECIQLLKPVIVNAPVIIGDVVMENIADTGIDIVATRTIAAKRLC